MIVPFDSFGAPPEWREADEPETPWTRRDRLVAAAIAFVLVVITVGECGALVRSWAGLSHGA